MFTGVFGLRKEGLLFPGHFLVFLLLSSRLCPSFCVKLNEYDERAE